jgi:hypothetical protein
MADAVELAWAGFLASLSIVTVLVVSNVMVSYFADGETLTGWVDKKMKGVMK